MSTFHPRSADGSAAAAECGPGRRGSPGSSTAIAVVSPRPPAGPPAPRPQLAEQPTARQIARAADRAAPGTRGGARGLYDCQLVLAGSDRRCRHQDPFAARVGPRPRRSACRRRARGSGRRAWRGRRSRPARPYRSRQCRTRHFGLGGACEGMAAAGRARGVCGRAGRQGIRRRCHLLPSHLLSPRHVGPGERRRRDQQRNSAPRQPDDTPQRRPHARNSRPIAAVYSRGRRACNAACCVDYGRIMTIGERS